MKKSNYTNKLKKHTVPPMSVIISMLEINENQILKLFLGLMVFALINSVHRFELKISVELRSLILSLF